MACTTTAKKVSLKLMVDKLANKVVFAEAGQEFVDLISQTISLPLSTFMSLLYAKGMGGSLGAFYKPIESPRDNFELCEGAMSILKPRTTLEGQVQNGVVYMVMDNMEVKPMSLALMKPFVKGFNVLEEKTIQVGSQEALAILKASFQTNAVLTTVFLGKKIEGLKQQKSSASWKIVYVLLVFLFVGFLAEENSRKMK